MLSTRCLTILLPVQYLQGLIDPSTKEVVKVAIPSPTMVHFRGGRSSIDLTAYPNLDEFFEDLAAAYRAEIKTLGDAGCKYLQVSHTRSSDRVYSSSPIIARRYQSRVPLRLEDA